MEAELSLPQVHWTVFDVPLLQNSSSGSSSSSSSSSGQTADSTSTTGLISIGEANGEALTRFYIKFLALDRCYALLVTDLTRVWCHSAEASEATSEHKHWNPHISNPLPVVLKRLQGYMVQQDPAVFYKFQLSGSQLDITVRKQLQSGYRFEWGFTCDQLFAEAAMLIRDQLLQPLLYLAGELKHRCDKLQRLLRAKDAVIEEYSTKGRVGATNRLALAKFEQDRFDEELLKRQSFVEGHHQSKALFSDTPALIMDRYLELELEREEQRAALENEELLRMEETDDVLDEADAEEQPSASTDPHGTLGLLAGGGDGGGDEPASASTSSSAVADQPTDAGTSRRVRRRLNHVPSETPEELERREELKKKLEREKKKKELAKKRKRFV